jgi:hypothetical protein
MAAHNAASGARFTYLAQQGIDEETLEVRAVEVTTNNIGDAPMLPELLNQIPPDQDIGRQVAEIQIRIAVRNRYTALGIPVTKPVG